ncbi:MAG: Hsp20/alpha crystallin family protein [Ktedonobacteraceae bacterium]
MQEQMRQQHIPVKVYRTAERLMVTTPMPGLEPENIRIEVTRDGQLVLQGEMRGMLKEVKELLLDEWSVGAYYRKLALPVSINAECANASYGNGVLTLAFPINDALTPARLTLERVTPTHGQRRGNAGHPPLCVHIVAQDDEMTSRRA